MAETVGPVENDKGVRPNSSLTPPVGNGLVRLTDLPEDVRSVVILGFEGAGKSLFPLRYAPTPVLLANLDRPLTRAHLGMLPKERAEQIYFRNLRESTEALTTMEATIIKDGVEQMLAQNLAWLKGGSFILDGGTLYRDVLKYADPKIGAAVEQGRKFNPKDKASVNTYLANLISFVQDKGINFYLTCHVAFAWKMQALKGDDGEIKNQLVKTNEVYPKFDDIAFERSNISLLMFKRCECGRNITSRDGTCEAISNSFDAKVEGSHVGRMHMTRIATNKFNTQAEGSIWENLDGKTLDTLSFNPKAAKLLLEAN